MTKEYHAAFGRNEAGGCVQAHHLAELCFVGHVPIDSKSVPAQAFHICLRGHEVLGMCLPGRPQRSALALLFGSSWEDQVFLPVLFPAHINRNHWRHGVSLSGCRPYQCGHCSQSFSQPSELRNHVVTHSSDRPFKCGYCGRAFAGATTLNNHIRTHTGEKPFK